MTALTARQRAERRWQPDLCDAILVKLLRDEENVAEEVPEQVRHIAHYTLTDDQVSAIWDDLRSNWDRVHGLTTGALHPAEVFDADELGSHPHDTAIAIAAGYLHEAQELLKNGKIIHPDCTGTAPVTHQNGVTA